MRRVRDTDKSALLGQPAKGLNQPGEKTPELKTHEGEIDIEPGSRVLCLGGSRLFQDQIKKFQTLDRHVI